MVDNVIAIFKIKQGHCGLEREYYPRTYRLASERITSLPRSVDTPKSSFSKTKSFCCKNKIAILGVTIIQMQEKWPNFLSLLSKHNREGGQSQKTIFFFFKHHKGFFLCEKCVYFKESKSKNVLIKSQSLTSHNTFLQSHTSSNHIEKVVTSNSNQMMCYATQIKCFLLSQSWHFCFVSETVNCV